MWFRYCLFLPTSPAPCYPICQCVCLLLFLPPSVPLVFTTSPPAPSPSLSPAPKRPPSAYVTYPPRMRPASGPRTARAFIPATATYRLGRQQRSAPHDRHQGPSQHDGTTAVGVVGGTIAGAGGGFGKCGGRRVCTTGRRREHAATGFEESTDNRGDKKRRILDICDTVFSPREGWKDKKKRHRQISDAGCTGRTSTVTASAAASRERQSHTPYPLHAEQHLPPPSARKPSCPAIFHSHVANFLFGR